MIWWSTLISEEWFVLNSGMRLKIAGLLVYRRNSSLRLWQWSPLPRHQREKALELSEVCSLCLLKHFASLLNRWKRVKGLGRKQAWLWLLPSRSLSLRQPLPQGKLDSKTTWQALGANSQNESLDGKKTWLLKVCWLPQSKRCQWMEHLAKTNTQCAPDKTLLSQWLQPTSSWHLTCSPLVK